MELPQVPAVDPAVRSDLKRLIENMPASRLLGIQVKGFAAQGVSVLELPIREELTFDGRTVQGGIVGALADYAGVSAAACTLEEGWMASTTAFEVQNLQAASGLGLVAVGRLVRMGKSTGVSRAEVFARRQGDSGPALTLVCIATTSCKPFRLPGG
jgi:uncharacterized protein (TIGR00369 family)